MTKRMPKAFILLCSFLFIETASAQQILPDFNEFSKQYSLANPDIYTFEKYNLNPVNHYTGKQAVNIPVYTIKSGNISYPLKLNYNTGGIKVDQLASDVGLGWSMSRAVITRTVVHDNDFDNLGAWNKRPDYALYTQAEKDTDWEGRTDYHSKHKQGYFLQK